MPSLISPRSLSLVAVAACLFTPFLTNSVSAQTPTLSAQRFLAEHPALKIPAQADRVLPGASMSQRTQFPGHVAPFAKTANRAGAPAEDSPLRLTALLNRSPEVQAAFEDLLAKQQDPASPLYHQWLTPAQVGALYGPTQNDIDAVTSWLASAGFTVDSVDPSRTRIHFTTTFGAAANAFKTSFANYTVGNDTLYSATEEPSLPAALSGVLGSVVGLSQVKVYSTLHKGTLDPSYILPESGAANPMFTFGTSQAHYLAPGDFNTIYDLTATLNAGYTGTGQRIAIIGQSTVATADITRYETLFGLPSTTVNVVIPTNGANPGIASDQDEQTLDVERVIATAPGATVDLVVSKSVGTNSGLGLALDWNVNTLVDKVMSVSYGTCESQYSASDAASDNSYFSQAASEGITTVISSGDSGATGCAGFTGSSVAAQVTPAINGLCGSQYVTCVGGTEFAEGSSSAYWSSSNGTYLTSALSYIPEGAWNDPSSVNSKGVTVYQAASTGGGPSAFIAKPTWQTGIGVPADGKRDVPDISFTSSANHDGYLICLSTSATCSTSDGLAVFGGTSAAAPGMAGIVALLNQRTSNTAGYGNLNPLLYSLAANNAYAFHDATVSTSAVSPCTASIPSFCNNSTPSTTSLSGGIPGFLLTAGYDVVTGLGSLDVGSFLSAAISSSTASYTLTANPSTITLQPGGATSATSTVTVASSGTFTGIVSLTCATARASGSIAGTCSVNPSTVALSSGISLPATVTLSGISGSGMLVATVTGTSGATIRTATIVANVPIPTFTVSPASSSLSLTAGGTSGNTDVFTITSTNGYAGAVNLTCGVAIASGTATVLPACSLSTSSVTLTSGSSATTTATLSTAATTTSCVSSNVSPSNFPRTLEITLAGLLLFSLPFHRRRGVRGLMALNIMAFGLAMLSGCGSGGSSGGGTTCTTTTVAGTTKGTYVVTVTGTGTSTGASSSVTNSNVFTFIVN